jgi:tRNA threonylcarbamoyladenosine biosynthesis protein TsaB
VKILGIDTSTRTLCLGASDKGRVYEYNLDLGVKISALLVPTIKRVTESLGWEMAQIDYFAAGIGPGSFTGTRVGLATVKALSWSLGKPLVGISSLDILAANAGAEHANIVAVIDAKRDMVYAGIYKKQPGRLRRVAQYMLLGKKELVQKIKANIPSRVLNDSVILGDGLNICSGECLGALKGIKILDKDHWRLEAGNLITLAKSAIEAGKASNPFKLEPLYLYPKECQIRKLKNSR